MSAAAFALALGAGLAAIAPGAAAQTAVGPAAGLLTLEEAIARALDHDDDLVIERLALDSAEAGERGAAGAYDPLLAAEAGWRRATLPINSAFSGAPAGKLAPTVEGAEAGAAIGQLLPTGGVVTVSADTSRDTTDGGFDLLSPAYGNRLGVELRQPLLRDRKIDAARLNLRVAAADRERALAALEREVSETVAAVERAYWELAASRREVEVRGEALELAGEQLSETEIRIEGGVTPETEIAQPRAEQERRRGELLAARERVARAENALKLLILGDDDGDLWSAPLAPLEDAATTIATVDLTAAMAAALAARAELTAAAAVIERRQAETAFARDRIRPVLDAVVSYDRLGLAGSRNRQRGGLPGLPTEVPPALEGSWGKSFEQLADGEFDDARVGLVFEVPIGNRTARANAEVASNIERQAEAELVRTRKEIRAEVLDAAAAVDTAAQRIEAARAAREAAEVQLSSERERFAVGLSTNFLVLTRQNDLAAARLEEIAALTDYRTARSELERATGSLLAERGIEIQAER